ncbi:MAG: thiamine diphosphokinase [Acidimicrobiales bacterium]
MLDEPDGLDDPWVVPGAAVVVAGGGPVDRVALAAIGPVFPDAVVYAADSGAEVASQLGLDVDVVVGDLDSISPGALAAAEAAGARIDRHPVAKDATDLALAVGTAIDDGAVEVLVLAGAGGRLDHLLAGALSLADARWGHVMIRAVLGSSRIYVVHGPGTALVSGLAAELVSLVPVGGPAIGVTTSGLRYPLVDATLEPGTTRGVSNVIEHPAGRVAVSLGAGALLVVLPGELDASPTPTDPDPDPEGP